MNTMVSDNALITEHKMGRLINRKAQELNLAAVNAHPYRSDDSSPCATFTLNPMAK